MMLASLFPEHLEGKQDIHPQMLTATDIAPSNMVAMRMALLFDRFGMESWLCHLFRVGPGDPWKS